MSEIIGDIKGKSLFIVKERDMADSNNQLPNKGDEFKFVNEKIIEKPKRKLWFIWKTLKLFVCAIVFGLVSCISFAGVLPYAQEYFKKEEVREPITIPKDVPETEFQAQPETPHVVETSSIEVVETEPIESIVKDALDEQILDLQDYSDLYSGLHQVVTKTNKSIVTVTSVKNNIDLFNNPYEYQGETSGFIFSKTEQEILIITNFEKISDADDLNITLLNDTVCQASLKKADKTTGVAILSVNTDDLEKDVFDRVEVGSLGNSYSIKQGDPLIAVGDPLEYNYSFSYGTVTSIKHMASVVDGTYRLIDSNILMSAEGNGYLINLKGEVVGIITNEFKSETLGNAASALAISDLKGVIERLSNGQDLAYLGVVALDVTDEIAMEMNLPIGVYVTESVINSPAYNSGIQNGDIITKIADTEIKNNKNLKNTLESLEVGDVIRVQIMRKGKDGYKTIEFNVTLGVQ